MIFFLIVPDAPLPSDPPLELRILMIDQVDFPFLIRIELSSNDYEEDFTADGAEIVPGFSVYDRIGDYHEVGWPFNGESLDGSSEGSMYGLCDSSETEDDDDEDDDNDDDEDDDDEDDDHLPPQGEEDHQPPGTGSVSRKRTREEDEDEEEPPAKMFGRGRE
ncbi:PREDICTED: nucleolar transcription factor 1-B-like [Cyprinodon variegatus]|uniref:nucleolar transcription factor 1-B-like n=1 Tax=Cyprinodon variegatus TaxID=28743 RepID=UPI0007425FB9|nr:PREDICTED: nucleolar transcription factor 1-B-like [Cyprinodon variegatus]